MAMEGWMARNLVQVKKGVGLYGKGWTLCMHGGFWSLSSDDGLELGMESTSLRLTSQVCRSQGGLKER